VKYLQTMPVGTRVVVLNLSRSLRILQGATSDPALLSAAVNTMEMNMDGRATVYPPPTPPAYAIWCMQQDMRNRATLESLNQIAASATEIKGKKNLIWFSPGFPTITDASVAGQPTCSDGPGASGIENQFIPLVKTYALLAAAQVTVYPIGAWGVGLPVPNPIGPGLVNSSSPTTYAVATAYDLLSFESMAEATGGAAFYNTNDLAGAMAKAISTGSDYYTLSYVPPGAKYDWAHHTIDISASSPDHPKLHLVYRKTYDAVDPATINPPIGLTLTTTPPEVVAGNMSAAMSRSMPTSTGIVFDVQVEPSTTPPNPADPPILGTLDPAVQAKLKGKPLARYSFSYSIPAAQLTFTPQPDGSHKGQTELDLSVFDTDGKRITGLSQTITMPLTDARYQQFIKGPFHFTQQLDLPPGQLFFLRIGVLDRTSNKVGTLEIPLTVPKR
jgi:VWFA-related protein